MDLPYHPHLQHASNTAKSNMPDVGPKWADVCNKSCMYPGVPFSIGKPHNHEVVRVDVSLFSRTQTFLQCKGMQFVFCSNLLAVMQTQELLFDR